MFILLISQYQIFLFFNFIQLNIDLKFICQIFMTNLSNYNIISNNDFKYMNDWRLWDNLSYIMT